MSHADLRALVAQLKTEIASLQASDHDARERLETLVADLEQRLEEGGEGAPPHEDLMDALRDSVERFEVEHPRATGILNHIMVTLGNIGI